MIVEIFQLLWILLGRLKKSLQAETEQMILEESLEYLEAAEESLKKEDYQSLHLITINKWYFFFPGNVYQILIMVCLTFLTSVVMKPISSGHKQPFSRAY